MRGRWRWVGSRPAVVPLAAVAIAALVAAAIDGTAGTHASARRPGVAAGIDGTAGPHASARRTAAPSAGQGSTASQDGAGSSALPPKGKGKGKAEASALPLKGKIVGIDPGHNGQNYANPGYIDQLVWNGQEWESCDTAGTSTDGGYTEALFTFQVTGYLRADLIGVGARVVLTRTTNDGVGPCVNTRADIIDNGHVNVAVDVHADGALASGRGFAVLEPVADGPNNAVIASSARFGADVRAAMLAYTTMPVSNYDGWNGITYRDDLAGLNLTTVPKVLIEVGNMKNATDAGLLTSATFQQQVAKALLAAIITFLR